MTTTMERVDIQSDIRVLVIDHVAILSVRDGIAHYRTFCCHAEVQRVPGGVVCQRCREPQLEGTADAWLTSNAGAWSRWSARWSAAEHHLAPNHSEVVERLATYIAARELAT